MASAILEEPKAPKRQATYADLRAVPEPLVAEILGGELFTHPRPAPKQSKASSALGSLVSDAFEFARSGPGGWVFFVEPELHLASEVVVPDVAGWRRERLSALPATPYFETAPDWVCEVTSPSTEKRDRVVKRTVYAGAGVEYYWVLDPRAELLETFRLESGSWTVGPSFADDADVSAPPFEAISFSLDLLWPLPVASETHKNEE